MGTMARYQTRRMINIQMLDFDSFSGRDIDDESLLAEMDKSINSVMNVIDMDNNVLLSNDFRGL